DVHGDYYCRAAQPNITWGINHEFRSLSGNEDENIHSPLTGFGRKSIAYILKKTNWPMIKFSAQLMLIIIIFIFYGSAGPLSAAAPAYPDGRPEARLRMEADDAGIVLRHGDGPDQCDIYGARDVWVFQSDGSYYMHYDAAGPTGWLCALAVSNDLTHWTKKG